VTGGGDLFSAIFFGDRSRRIGVPRAGPPARREIRTRAVDLRA